MMIPEIGKPFFMFNPKPATTDMINSNLGTMTFTDKVITFDGVLNNEKVITLDGHINTVNTVEVGGIAVSYSFEAGHNVILLDDYATGVAKVNYVTSAVAVYSNNGYYNSSDNTRTYKVQYLDQLLEESVVQKSDDDDNDDDTDTVDANGDSCLFVRPEESIKRDKEFSVYISSGSTAIMFMFISDDSQQAVEVNLNIPAHRKGSFDDDFIVGMTTESATISTTTSATVEDLNYYTGRYGFYLPENINPTGFKIGAIDIAMQTGSQLPSNGVYQWYSTDVKTIGQTVTISYETPATKYNIPACGLTNTVKRLEVFYCDWSKEVIEYPDESDDDIISCEIPQTFTINVPSLLGVSPSTAIGKVITGNGSSYTVDSFGKIYVEVTVYDKVILDCSAVQKGREIYIDTTNAEVV
jgi:hypothetical protein